MDTQYTFMYPEELEKAMLQLADSPELYSEFLELLEKSHKSVPPPFPEGFEKDSRWKTGDNAKDLWDHLPEGCGRSDHEYHWLWKERQNASTAHNAKKAKEKEAAKAEAEQAAAEGKGWSGETDWQKVNPNDPTVDWSKVTLPAGANKGGHPAHDHWTAKFKYTVAHKNDPKPEAGSTSASSDTDAPSSPKPVASAKGKAALAKFFGKPADTVTPADSPKDTPAPAPADTPSPAPASPKPVASAKGKAAVEAAMKRKAAGSDSPTPDASSPAPDAGTPEQASQSTDASVDTGDERGGRVNYADRMMDTYKAKVAAGEIPQELLDNHTSGGFEGAPIYIKKRMLCRDNKYRTYRCRVNKDDPGVQSRNAAVNSSDITDLGKLSDDDFILHAMSGHEGDRPELNTLFIAMMQADDDAADAKAAEGTRVDTGEDDDSIESDVNDALKELYGDFDAEDAAEVDTPKASDTADSESPADEQAHGSARIEHINSFMHESAEKIAALYDSKEEFNKELAGDTSKEVYADEPDDASDDKVHPDEYTEGGEYDASKDTRYDNAPTDSPEPDSANQEADSAEEPSNSDDAYSDVKSTDVNGNVKNDTDWGNDKKLAEAKDDTEDDNQDLDSVSSYDSHAEAEKRNTESDEARDSREAYAFSSAGKGDISGERSKVDKLRKIADDITGISAAFKNSLGNWVAGLATQHGVETGMSQTVARIRSRNVPTLSNGLEGFSGQATDDGLQFTIPVDPTDKNKTESVTIPWKDFDPEDPADTAMSGLQTLIKKKISYFDTKYSNK